MTRDQLLRFSLSQIIAGTAVVLAVPTLFRVLLWPPVGQTGLSGALLATCVLFIGLWFSRRDMKSRLWAVAIGGSLIGLIWFVFWLDHGMGFLFFGSNVSYTPEPWIIVATISAFVGLLAGWRWWVNHNSSHPMGWPTRMAMVALLLSSGCVALVGGTQIPRAIRGLDAYATSNAWVATPGVLTIKARFRSPDEIARYLRQSNSPNRGVVIESIANWQTDAVLLPVLIHLLSDDHADVRGATARTLDHWAENRLQQSATGSPKELTSAVLALAIALDHDDALIRQYAARFLEDPYFLDHRSYASLPPSSLPVLIQASQRPEENVRNRARFILKSVERAQKIEPAIP